MFVDPRLVRAPSAPFLQSPAFTQRHYLLLATGLLPAPPPLTAGSASPGGEPDGATLCSEPRWRPCAPGAVRVRRGLRGSATSCHLPAASPSHQPPCRRQNYPGAREPLPEAPRGALPLTTLLPARIPNRHATRPVITLVPQGASLRRTRPWSLLPIPGPREPGPRGTWPIRAGCVHA